MDKADWERVEDLIDELRREIEMLKPTEAWKMKHGEVHERQDREIDRMDATIGEVKHEIEELKKWRESHAQVHKNIRAEIEDGLEATDREIEELKKGIGVRLTNLERAVAQYDPRFQDHPEEHGIEPPAPKIAHDVRDYGPEPEIFRNSLPRKDDDIHSVKLKEASREIESLRGIRDRLQEWRVEMSHHPAVKKRIEKILKGES